MAGSTNVPKFVPCNRENEAIDFHQRGSSFYVLDATTIGATGISATQILFPRLFMDVFTPNAIAGPTEDALTTLLQQRAEFVFGQSFTGLIENADNNNDKTITFGPEFTPNVIIIPANTTVRWRWMISSVNPPTYFLIEFIVTGNPFPGPLPNGGNNFQLEPNVAQDIIVRNLADTAWVPSGTGAAGNPGHLPGLHVSGRNTVNNGVARFDDQANAAINIGQVCEFAMDGAQNAFAELQVVDVIAGNALFGNRGVGTLDTVLRTNLPAGGGPNGDHLLCVTSGLVRFRANSSGQVFLNLAAGPAATAIGVNAAGFICAFP